MKNPTEKVAITAAELAEFMGISVRTLARLDAKGILVAARRKSGRRYYTNEHIIKAVELLEGKRRREAKVRFYKSGAESISGSILIPKGWLTEMGITKEKPCVQLSFDGRSVHISAGKK